MRKGEVSQTIIVIGVLALVAITVGMAYLSLDRVNLPEDEKQVLRGNHLRISGGLAELADSCWRKSGQGARSKVMDCFSVRAYSNATVTASNISRDLELLPERNFGMTGGPVPAREVRLQVSYLPVEERVNITLVEVCRPSGGDTCYSTSCSCGTACAPGFDPDGDGDTETDSKGCVESYDFEPSFNPCSSSSSLTCSDSSIYRSGNQQNGYFTFDIGEKIGLRNVTIVERPSNSFHSFREADSESKLSPQKVVGYGSPQRKLFTGEGNISVSGLTSGDYAVFVWGCDNEGGAPSNCRWLRPFQPGASSGGTASDIQAQSLNFQVSGSDLTVSAEVSYDLQSTESFEVELGDSSGVLKTVSKSISGQGSFTVSETVSKPGSSEEFYIESDVNDDVTESDEQNNQKNRVFNPSGTSNDFEATEISFQEVSGDLEVTGTVQYDLQNSEDLNISIYREGNLLDHEANTISGQGSQSFTHEVQNVPGSNTEFKVSADQLDSVSEDDEGNNNYSEIFIPSSTVNEIEAKDLTVSESGGQLDITGTVNYSLDQQKTFEAGLYKSGSEIERQSFTLQGQGEKTLNNQISVPSSSTQIKIASDISDSVQEPDEGDNNLTETYSPSSTTTTYTVDLGPGWNIISSPVQDSIELSSIGSCSFYDLKNSKKAVTLDPGPVYTNQIDGSSGYLVRTQSGCTFQKEGTPAPKSSIQVESGWNLISINGTMSDYTGCGSKLGFNGHTVWDWETSSDIFDYAVNDPWEGFYVKSSGSCTLTKN